MGLTCTGEEIIYKINGVTGFEDGITGKIDKKQIYNDIDNIIFNLVDNWDNVQNTNTVPELKQSILFLFKVKNLFKNIDSDGVRYNLKPSNEL